MKVSGRSDIFLEAGIIGQGYVDGVMGGIYYERAMSCHKTIHEYIERLLLEQYLKHAETENIFTDLPPDLLVQLTAFLSKPSKAYLESVISDEAIYRYISRYMAHRKDVQEGRMGKTAQLWITYTDHIHLLLALEPVKQNNFELYVHTLNLMADNFFSFKGQNYARYLTYMDLFLANIDHSHPGARDLLKQGAISVARSFAREPF